MEVSVKPHPGRTAQIEITRQQMGHGMPDTGSESWNELVPVRLLPFHLLPFCLL